MNPTESQGRSPPRKGSLVYSGFKALRGEEGEKRERMEVRGESQLRVFLQASGGGGGSE